MWLRLTLRQDCPPHAYKPRQYTAQFGRGRGFTMIEKRESARHEPTVAPVYSAYVCNNDELIAQVARLYLTDGDRIADVSYGKGVFWRKVDLSRFDFHPSDICTCPDALYDFRSLPYQDRSFDVVVLDPPYSHDPGRGMITNSSYRNFETTGSLDHEGIVRLYAEGMREANRILRPGAILLVKVQDEIQSGKQRMTHIEIHDHAIALGMIVEDLFVMVRPAPPPVQHRQKHSRKRHSYLWVFRTGG